MGRVVGRATALAVLAVIAIASGGRLFVRAQVSLEEVAVKSFEISAQMQPVPYVSFCDASGCRAAANGSLKARTIAGLEVTGPAPLPALRMFLDRALVVKSVTGPGVTFRRDGNVLVLAFDPPLLPRSQHTVTFEYEGKPPVLWDDLILADDGTLYPVLISPFGDLSANRAPIQTTVTIPDGYYLASTGEVTRQEAGGVQIYRWKTGEALPYIAVAGAKGYRIEERRAGAIPLVILVRPRADRLVSQIAEFTQKATEFYSHLLFPFPTGRVTVLSAPFGRGLLGLGFPSLMLLAEEAFTGTDATLNRDSLRLLLVAHEAAHSYFPAQISGKGVAAVWLSEGFAEYLGLMTVEVVMGERAFARELEEERRTYARIAGADLPIGSYTRVNSLTPAGLAVRYAKGAYVLHMLRHVVGSETFARILSTFATRFRGESVRVDTFAQVASEVAGQDLSWFFQEWITQRVLPDYTITAASSAPIAGGFKTTVTVKNLGTGSMPIDVVFEMDGGATATRRVMVGSQAEVAVELVTPAAVRRVEVDPQKWVLQSNYANDAIVVR